MEQARRSPRIGDVALQAGVSVATVSRALSAPEKLRDETRRKVLAAVEALGYTPNSVARQLRGGTSQLVLVVVPRRSNPPFFSEVLHGIDVTLADAGYVLITGYMEGVDRDLRLIELAASGNLAGLLTTSGMLPEVSGRSILDAGLPAVAICADPLVPGLPAVLLDDEAAARAQVDHLIGLGHRRIFYVTGPTGNYNETVRHRGIVAGIDAAGLGSDALTQYAGNYQFTGGVAGARAYLEMTDRPTGVICGNDECAVAFMKTVTAAGLQIPRDLSVVGFDGIEFADYCEPTLTTIAQPRFALGAAGARLLIDILAGRTPAALQDGGKLVMQGHLRVGDSTAAPPGVGPPADGGVMVGG
ncbi:substrate-binding domain-containing protein [Aurantimonas endophytica]|uniref:LacI family repressor for deo operon, udp, cdd, tsx, nupC, and nupG n=1 Tax=Aurantimonas endophytica TaxID=1522175 RepID=A0A7W6MQV0_9HYPH|nr:LacI family repressor for deo operon, udp, cdd, tsx, nupC, and nupG [Aurantimonas endophytica]MCO6405209.1 substrate-binding domain-containing protein [Aurantimonas endophytica]